MLHGTGMLPIRLNLSIEDPVMYHDVVDVKCLEDFKLKLTFDDGTSGVLDCKGIIAKGGVFAALADPQVFRAVTINRELGVITWKNDIDIAPETAYSLATGSDLPEWMESSEQVA